MTPRAKGRLDGDFLSGLLKYVLPVSIAMGLFFWLLSTLVEGLVHG